MDIDDEEIPYLFYRGDEPPHVATPTGTWTDRSVALADLDASVQAFMDDARFEEADPRTVGRPHPVFGLLDGHQWLLFAAAHTLRHHAQVLGVTATFAAQAGSMSEALSLLRGLGPRDPG